MGVLGALQTFPSTIPDHSSSRPPSNQSFFTRRKSILFASSVLAPFLQLDFSFTPSFQSARAIEDEFQQQEELAVHLFQETSPSVVFIEDIEIVKPPKNANEATLTEDENAKVEGTGSGFI